jgi:hypothetical protein
VVFYLFCEHFAKTPWCNVFLTGCSHVLTEHLSIDLAPLCDFLEWLLASIVITWRWPNNTHGTVLPKSWLARVLAEPQRRPHNLRSIALIPRLCDALVPVLEGLYTGHFGDGQYSEWNLIAPQTHFLRRRTTVSRQDGRRTRIDCAQLIHCENVSTLSTLKVSLPS